MGLYHAALGKTQTSTGQCFFYHYNNLLFEAHTCLRLPTTSCGNEFHPLIMILVESILSWVSCFKLANCSFYCGCFLCYEIEWKPFVIHFLSTIHDCPGALSQSFSSFAPLPFENPKAFLFSFLVQKPLNTFDHPVALFFILLLLSCHFWGEMTGTVFNIQNAWWAVDFFGSIIILLLLFSVLFLVFHNILLYLFFFFDSWWGFRWHVHKAVSKLSFPTSS